jgi:hypothetical protein
MFEWPGKHTPPEECMVNQEAAGHYHDPANRSGARTVEDFSMKRGLVYGSIIIAAMLAFELFNYTTTDFALTNLLGDLRFVGLRWATILAIAFCGMDFAGIARLFTPARQRGERTEVWYLLAAWFLAATMNAMLTWWGVSLALLTHEGLGNEILSRDTLLAVVPVFVAVLIWLIRILLIGLLSMAGDRLFSFMEDTLRADLAEDDEIIVAESPLPQPQPRAPAPAPLPTAAWAPAQRPVNVSNAPRTARVIGNAADEGGSARPATVAERHGYGRYAQNNRPANPPPPAASVRPAPKPAAVGVPARVGGHSNGGNGNGHTRHSDPDFDD